MLNRIMVDYYGTPTPIQQVANVSVRTENDSDSYGRRACSKLSEKAIMVSDVWYQSTNDGTAVRLIFPELTERRKELALKMLRKRRGGESCNS